MPKFKGINSASATSFFFFRSTAQLQYVEVQYVKG